MSLMIYGLRIDWDRISGRSYLRDITSIANLDELQFNKPITFFVGENGSGKSTLLEAIAVQYGFNPEGGTKNYALNKAFTKLIGDKLNLELAESLLYTCQDADTEHGRPDIAGYKDGILRVLCEAKFYAGLTDNQPTSYLKRLIDEGGAGLVFICPENRIVSLWDKVCKKAEEQYKGTEINKYCINAVKTKAATVKDEISEMDMEKILDSCYKQAVDGIPKVSKPIDELVENYARKYDTNEAAAKALIKGQLAKCSTSGFLAGLGGVITLPVAIPANISSVIYVQLRMIAAIAKLGGYDPRDDQVQTLAYVCLTGQAVGAVMKDAGINIGGKMAVAGIKKIPGEALKKINQKVGFRLLTKFGETGAINLGKAVPVVGGLIGGGFDFATTKIIADNAYKMFIINSI